MMYKIILSNSATKYFKRLNEPIQSWLKAAMEEMKTDPWTGDVKAIGGRPGMWRRRVGDYRIIYFVDSKARVIKVADIGNRKDIYR